MIPIGNKCLPADRGCACDSTCHQIVWIDVVGGSTRQT